VTIFLPLVLQVRLDSSSCLERLRSPSETEGLPTQGRDQREKSLLRLSLSALAGTTSSDKLMPQMWPCLLVSCAACSCTRVRSHSSLRRSLHATLAHRRRDGQHSTGSCSPARGNANRRHTRQVRAAPDALAEPCPPGTQGMSVLRSCGRLLLVLLGHSPHVEHIVTSARNAPITRRHAHSEKGRPEWEESGSKGDSGSERAQGNLFRAHAQFASCPAALSVWAAQGVQRGSTGMASDDAGVRHPRAALRLPCAPSIGIAHGQRTGATRAPAI
jgi:hypothetical protein